MSSYALILASLALGLTAVRAVKAHWPLRAVDIERVEAAFTRYAAEEP